MNLGELGLAVEHEEGVDEVVVRVRLHSLEVWPEPELYDLELGQLRQDAMVPRSAGDQLAAVPTDRDPFHGASIPRGVALPGGAPTRRRDLRTTRHAAS